MTRRAMATLLALLALAPAARAADPARTEAVVERLAAAAGSGSGAYAVDLDTGAVIASRRSGTRRVPASVEKLFTTSAALLRFGPEGTLATTLLAEAEPALDGVLASDVWIRGAGDPTLSAAGLRDLASQVATAGITRIEGDIYADETAFDTLRGPPSEGYAASQWVGPLSALAYERGRYPAAKVPVFMRRALAAQGVKVTGRARAGVAPNGAQPLATLESPPMAWLARATNVWSDNWYAELLLKAIGAQSGAVGTTAAGARAARSTLASAFGVRPRIADGSGLSRSNRTSPRQVVRLLAGMDDRAEGEALEASLAVAGRSGTLAERMRRNSARGRCAAKTGTLIGISALAGYCTARSGARVAFAFLMNGVNPYRARRLQNRMTGALARYRP